MGDGGAVGGILAALGLGAKACNWLSLGGGSPDSLTNQQGREEVVLPCFAKRQGRER